MISDGGKEISVQGLLGMVRRRLLLVFIPMVALTVAVAFYAYRRPVLYRAQALIGVESNTRDYIQRTEPNARVQDQLLTIRQVLLSRPVLEPVAANFHIFPAPSGKLSDADLDRMREKVKIIVQTDDSFQVGFEGVDRTQVMNVANDLSERFIKMQANARARQVTDASGLLDAELETLRKTLDEQEERVKRYKERAVNELPDRLETNLRLMAATQAQMQASSGSKANDQARLAAVREEMAELQKQGVLEAPATKEKTPQEVKLDELKLHLKQLRATVTDKYPEIASTEREIQDLEKAIAATPSKAAVAEPGAARMRYLQLKAEKESLEHRLKSYAQEESTLASDMGRLQQRVQSTPQHESAITELMRGYEATKIRYNLLLSKQQEVRLASGLERVNKTMSFRIVEPATLPAGPSTPRRSRLLLMGLFAGLGVGLMIAFAAEQMDTTLGSVAEFQAHTDVPVVTALPSMFVDPKARAKTGVIPAIPTGGSDLSPANLSVSGLHGNHIVALTDPDSVASEQYRLLALKIRRHLNSATSPVLVVSSFVGGEGKTVTSLNLSVSLAGALSGRVLLIDSDLRKPRVHEYLGLKPSKGFSDLLLAPEDELGKYVWKLKDLYVMSGGSNLTNPVNLLASKAARNVLDRLRSEFDFIVIDTPPLLPVVDAHILAGLADGVILVVRARHTRREMIDLGLESFQGTNLLGAVINDVDYQSSSYALAYGYYNKTYSNAK